MASENIYDLIIVGGGPGGLALLKSATKAGLRSILLDKNDDVGGIWSGGGHAWKAMKQNLSHYSCMFSDYPWSLHCTVNGISVPDPLNKKDDFKTREEVQAYFEGYCAHFDLRNDIQKSAKVTSVRPSRVEDDGANWSVTWETANRAPVHLRSRFCAVASGVFGNPVEPSRVELGIDAFTGSVVHSAGVRDPTEYKGKHVVIIGASFSGCELSVALQRAGARVSHVARSFPYVVSRHVKEKAVDFAFYSRAAAQKKDRQTPAEIYGGTHKALASLTKQSELPEEMRVGVVQSDGTLPTDVPPPQTVISDDYTSLVTSGSIRLYRGSLCRSEGPSVWARRASDGTEVELRDVDTVLLCTGYTPDLSFVDANVLRCAGMGDGAVDAFLPLLLHKTVFPALPDALFEASKDSLSPKDALAPVSLAFVGLFRGPFIPTLELQARWAAYVFAGKIDPPTHEELLEGVKEARAVRDAKPRPQFPYGNYVSLSDSIAKECGVLPPFAVVSGTDEPSEEWGGDEEASKLRDAIQTGFPSPAMYRLRGFENDPDAAMETIKEVQRAAARMA